MKVFNLQCRAQHAFEGWFASSEDYDSQSTRGLLACPLCGDTEIHKLPSAPRLNFGADGPTEPQTQPQKTEAQTTYLQLARHILAQTEDVGERFADEARKMHYGEAEERGIRGRASHEQTQALLEEGIPVLPLPLPEALKGPVH